MILFTHVQLKNSLEVYPRHFHFSTRFEEEIAKQQSHEINGAPTPRLNVDVVEIIHVVFVSGLGCLGKAEIQIEKRVNKFVNGLNINGRLIKLGIGNSYA